MWSCNILEIYFVIVFIVQKKFHPNHCIKIIKVFLNECVLNDLRTVNLHFGHV